VAKKDRIGLRTSKPTQRKKRSCRKWGDSPLTNDFWGQIHLVHKIRKGARDKRKLTWTKKKRRGKGVKSEGGGAQKKKRQ